jgi:hypothetical protein
MTHLSGAPIRLQSKGWLLALTANIRQVWKDWDNNEHSSLLQYGNNYGSKSFIAHGASGDGWIQTLAFGMTKLVFYHFATGAGQYLTWLAVNVILWLVQNS